MADYDVESFKLAEPTLYEKIYHLLLEEVQSDLREQTRLGEDDKEKRVEVRAIKNDYIPYLSALLGNVLVLENVNKGELLENKNQIEDWFKSFVADILTTDEKTGKQVKKFAKFSDVVTYPRKFIKRDGLSPNDAVEKAEKELYGDVEKIEKTRNVGFSWQGFSNATSKLLGLSIQKAINGEKTSSVDVLNKYDELLKKVESVDADGKQKLMLSARSTYKKNYMSKKSLHKEAAKEYLFKKNDMANILRAMDFQLNKSKWKFYDKDKKSFIDSPESKKLDSQILLLDLANEYACGLSSAESLLSAILEGGLDGDDNLATQFLRCLPPQYSVLQYVSDDECAEIVKDLKNCYPASVTKQLDDVLKNKESRKYLENNQCDPNLDIISHIPAKVKEKVLKKISKDTYTDQEVEFYIWQHSMDVYQKIYNTQGQKQETSAMPQFVQNKVLVEQVKSLCRLNYFLSDEETSKKVSQKIRNLALVACNGSCPPALKEICGKETTAKDQIFETIDEMKDYVTKLSDSLEKSV